MSLVLYGGIAVIGALAVHKLIKKRNSGIINYEYDEAIKNCKLNAPVIRQQLFLYKSKYEYKSLGMVVGVHEKGNNVYVAFKRDKQTKVLKGQKKDFDTLKPDEPKILVKGMVLKPQVDGFLEINRDNDKKKYEEYYQYELPEALNDSMRLSQSAISISPHHQKRLEQSNLYDDANPLWSGNGQSENQGNQD